MEKRRLAPRIDMMPDGSACFIVADAQTGEVLARAASVAEVEQCSVDLVNIGASLELVAKMEREAYAALRTETIPSPPGWKDDELSRFFAAAQYNVRATFHGRRPEFERLKDIDDVFTKIVHDWVDPDPYIPSLFFLRARAAYMNACGLAMGAQFPEAYSIMRGCLESSLYALLIAKSPEAAMIWLHRNDDEESKRVAKRVFQNSGAPKKGEPIRPYDILAQEDAALRAAVDELYERTIDMGSHPNRRSIFTNMTRIEDEDGVKMMLNYLNPDPVAMELCLKSVAQVGICALRIFSFVFPSRYDGLKISAKVERLSVGL